MVGYLVKSINNALVSTGSNSAVFRLDDNILVKANLDVDVTLINKQKNGKYECVTYDINGFVQKTEYMSEKDINKLLKKEMLSVARY